MWNTYRLDRDYTNVQHKSTKYLYSNKPRSVLKKKNMPKKAPFMLDYTKLSKMEYNIEEHVEEKIAKHAILEALFQT